MARLNHVGFELNSLTNGVEFISVGTNTGSIQTSIVHGGVYAYRNNPSASIQNVTMQMATGTLKTGFARFYYYVTTHPASGSLVFAIVDSSGTNILMRLRGTGSGLRVINGPPNTQVGSDFTVSTGAYHYIDIKLFSNSSTGTIDVLLDGVSKVSVTGQNTGGQDIAVFQFGSGAALTHDYYIDDVALNDSTADILGSNTSYPGVGKIICMRPDSAGDSTQWTIGGSSPAATNFGSVNEVTPDDGVTFVESVTANQIDMYNCGASGIGSSDTVKAVGIGVRLANDVADVVTALQVRVESAASGTIQSSAGIAMGTTIWRTNGPSTLFNPYPIMSDATPDSVPWTKANLDSMQIGIKLLTAGTNKLRVSTMWAMVDYVPSAFTLKTVNGLGNSSIKTLQSLAKASAKTYDGLTVN